MHLCESASCSRRPVQIPCNFSMMVVYVLLLVRQAKRAMLAVQTLAQKKRIKSKVCQLKVDSFKAIDGQDSLSICLYNSGLLTAPFPESMVRVANMGPTWGRQDPGGPHVGPMNLAIRVALSATVLSGLTNDSDDGLAFGIRGMWLVWLPHTTRTSALST